MKRFAVLLLLAAAGTFVLAERSPWVHDRAPWLPHVPWLEARLGASPPATGGAEPREGSRGRRDGRSGRGGPGGPIPVLAAPARFADLPITVDVLGTVQATNTVTVRGQVDGKLIEIDFREGQDVRKGDVLARIDPATYQAQYDQAVAKKAQDDSVLANAKVDLDRYVKLAATQYGSHQQADTQKALVTQTEAITQQDQASIDNLKAILDYATIRSPIDGRTGIRLIDQGNIVHASDTTGIVTVTQVRPIAAVFSLPQRYLGAVNAAMAKDQLAIEAFDGQTHALLDTGVLQVVDNTVDQTTGTVKLKGTFPNAALQLWPGQFVDVRLHIGMLDHAVVVATSAVQRGPDGTFVYVVNPDDTVAMRKVEVGRQTEADTVITAGVTPPTPVVTTGFTRLNDKAKVVVGPPNPDGAADAATPGQSASGQPDTSAAPAPAGDAPAPADDGAARHRRGTQRGDGARRTQDQGSPQN